MAKMIMIGLAAMTVGLPANASAQSGRFSDDRAEAVEHGWLFDYDKAKKLARESKRPLMLVFRCVP